MSLWNPDNVRDVAESIGISALSDEVLAALTSDIEFRISSVLQEAWKFMRHSKRSTLFTQDVALALRIMEVEPLYGYESTRPLRFGEASIGPGQPLFYVEDEEVDFEKLINAPLPKVAREIKLTGIYILRAFGNGVLTFIAHWLAVEGVQPSTAYNPTTADSRSQELVPKGPGANPNISAISGNDNVTVKPLVKHVLSKELLLYFEKVCGAVLDEASDEYRSAALASIRADPGLHQLVPYFVQFISDKVTHNLKDLFVLRQIVDLTASMLENDSLFLDPYVGHGLSRLYVCVLMRSQIASLIPPILTCVVGRKLGPPQNINGSVDSLASYPLREIAASLLASICKKYAKTSHTLKPRLARTCLKNFLDPTKPLCSNYGGILGLHKIGGPEVIRGLIVPNVSEYDRLILRDAMEGDESKRKEVVMVTEALVEAMSTIEEPSFGQVNGYHSGDSEEIKNKLRAKIGELASTRILELGRPKLVKAIMEAP